MRKYSLLLIPLLLWGCEKDFENVINSFQNNYQVVSVSFVSHQPSYDLKTPADSLLKLRIVFAAGSEINSVGFNLYASNNALLNASPVQMQTVNPDVYEGQFILKREYPNGNYKVNFLVTGKDGSGSKAATTGFEFNNGQDNVAPVISNLVISDTISRGVSFIFTVTATDSNGLNDIEFVYFQLFRPDSTAVENPPNSGNTYFLMHDDGNFDIFGDATAGDGIFSFKNSFGDTSQTGNWRFLFQAEDRSDSLSNIIEHFLFVQ